MAVPEPKQEPKELRGKRVPDGVHRLARHDAAVKKAREAWLAKQGKGKKARGKAKASRGRTLRVILFIFILSFGGAIALLVLR